MNLALHIIALTSKCKLQMMVKEEDERFHLCNMRECACSSRETVLRLHFGSNRNTWYHHWEMSQHWGYVTSPRVQMRSVGNHLRGCFFFFVFFKHAVVLSNVGKLQRETKAETCTQWNERCSDKGVKCLGCMARAKKKNQMKTGDAMYKWNDKNRIYGRMKKSETLIKIKNGLAVHDSHKNPAHLKIWEFAHQKEHFSNLFDFSPHVYFINRANVWEWSSLKQRPFSK